MLVSIASTSGWTPLLLSICVITTLGTTLPIGYFFGVLNTPAKFIQSWCNETLIHEYDSQLSESQLNVLWASILSIFQIGGICGSFFSAWCSDKYGRKGTLIISSILLLVSSIMFFWCRSAKSLEMILCGRFIGGLAAALVVTSHPMYLLELAPASLSGSVGVFTGIGITGGIFVAQIITLPEVFGTEAQWHYALSFFALLVLLGLLPFYWFPESPRWLYILKHDANAAENALKCLRGIKAKDNVQQEMQHMSLEATNLFETTKRSFFTVLKDPTLFLPIFLICTLQTTQQLSGINAIFFYSISIFEEAGFTTEVSTWLNIGIGFFNLCISLIGPLLLYKFPRRLLMMISCFGCALGLFCMSFGLFYMYLVSWLPGTCIFIMLIFIFSFQVGLAPIPYFIGSELLEVTPRPVAMSMGSLFSWIGNFLIGMCFPLLLSVWSSFAFMPCCCICIFSLLLTWRYLPETRGRDPKDLKVLLSNGFKSKIK